MTTQEVFGFLLQARTTAHLLHFHTRKYSQHIALEQFYTELLQLTDTLIETYQGTQGLQSIKVKESITEEWSDPTDFIRYINDTLVVNRNLFTRDSHLNVFDDILTLTEQTLYKLTYLQ